MPLPDRVETVKYIAVTTNKKQLTSFIGVLNHYTDMWKQYRSEILTPLTIMTSK